MGQHDGWRFGNALTHFRYRSRVMVREGEDMIYDPGGTPIVDVGGPEGDVKVFRSGGKVAQVSWSAATNSLLAYSGG